MHLTGPEGYITSEQWAKHLLNEITYFSDRWTWDRVIRAQWIYKRLCDSLHEQWRQRRDDDATSCRWNERPMKRMQTKIQVHIDASKYQYYSERPIEEVATLVLIGDAFSVFQGQFPGEDSIAIVNPAACPVIELDKML